MSEPLPTSRTSTASHAGEAPVLVRPTHFTVQQACYASALTERQAGYQLVARSSGVSTALGRELARWCPTHDALCEGNIRALSFFPLSGEHFALGYTTPSGDEYSGRRGDCLTTQLLVVTTQALAAFGHHPLRLFDAARAGGHLRLAEAVPEKLPELRLLAPGVREEPAGGPPDPACGQEVARLLVAHRQVAICGVPQPLRYAERLFDSLALHVRKDVSFTTSLRYSPQRPVRLLILGDDDAQRRQLRRVRGMALVESTKGDLPEEA